MPNLLSQLPGLLMLLALGGAIYWVLLVTLTGWMITHPPRRSYAGAIARGLAGDPGELEPARAFESWTLRARGRDLPVWDLPGDAPDGPIVVCSHGWGDGKVGVLVRLGALLPVASRVIAWDMRGHADAPSGGSSLGATDHLDLLGLLDCIDPDERTNRGVVLLGWSQGAGVSIAAAGGQPDGVIGVIAESPYRMPWTPARGVMQQRRLPWRLNLRPALVLVGLVSGAGAGWTRFDRAAHAARLGCPLLILHGDQDPVSPIEDGRAIAEAGEDGSLVTIEGGTHNDLWFEPAFLEQSGEAVRSFIGGL